MAIGRINSYHRQQRGRDPMEGSEIPLPNLTWVPEFTLWETYDENPLDEFLLLPGPSQSSDAQPSTFTLSKAASIDSIVKQPDVAGQFVNNGKYYAHIEIISTTDPNNALVVKVGLGDNYSDKIPMAPGIHTVTVVADFTERTDARLLCDSTVDFSSVTLRLLSITSYAEAYKPPDVYWDQEIMPDAGFDNSAAWQDPYGWVHDGVCDITVPPGEDRSIRPAGGIATTSGVDYVATIDCGAISNLNPAAPSVWIQLGYIGDPEAIIIWSNVGDGRGVTTYDLPASLGAIRSVGPYIVAKEGESAVFESLSIKAT